MTSSKHLSHYIPHLRNTSHTIYLTFETHLTLYTQAGAEPDEGHSTPEEAAAGVCSARIDASGMQKLLKTYYMRNTVSRSSKVWQHILDERICATELK